MPLYKNDVIYELSRFPKEIEAVETFFHNKFPVKVVYPPERIIKSKLKNNIKPDKPNSIAFDLKATVKSPTGAEVWRYAENVIIGENGKKKYIPQSFTLFGTKMLDRNEIELIYFLLRKSPYCRGGDNAGPMTKFMFEDLVTEAEKRAVEKKIKVKVDRLLYDDEGGLSDTKLVAVAKAYHILGVDTLTLNQVRNVLENKIFATPNGPNEFFSMVDDDMEIKARKAITDAMDKGILAYEAGKKRWAWNSVRENGKIVICAVPADKTPNQAIYDVYKGDNQFREDLNAVLLTGDPTAGKGKKKEKDKEDNEE